MYDVAENRTVAAFVLHLDQDPKAPIVKLTIDEVAQRSFLQNRQTTHATCARVDKQGYGRLPVLIFSRLSSLLPKEGHGRHAYV